jgi:hypothetical protein
MLTLVAKFEQSNFYPLNHVMTCFHVVRFMLLSKKYTLAPTWIAPYGGKFSSRSTYAWFRIHRTHRMTGDIDIYDVLCVLTRGDYGPGSEAAEAFEVRDTRFDDMTLDQCKRLSRQAHQAIQPHLQNGLLVADIDLTVLFQDDNLAQFGVAVVPGADGDEVPQVDGIAQDDQGEVHDTDNDADHNQEGGVGVQDDGGQEQEQQVEGGMALGAEADGNPDGLPPAAGFGNKGYIGPMNLYPAQLFD